MAKVIVVDDSAIIHKVLGRRLSDAGHQVVAFASDGQKGYEEFVKHRPEIVLMDITMPNCDGRQALKMILKETPGARVIMLSALCSPEMIEECLKMGAVGFVSKERLQEQGYLEGELSRQTLKAA